MIDYHAQADNKTCRLTIETDNRELYFTILTILTNAKIKEQNHNKKEVEE